MERRMTAGAEINRRNFFYVLNFIGFQKRASSRHLGHVPLQPMYAMSTIKTFSSY